MSSRRLSNRIQWCGQEVEHTQHPYEQSLVEIDVTSDGNAEMTSRTATTTCPGFDNRDLERFADPLVFS